MVFFFRYVSDQHRQQWRICKQCPADERIRDNAHQPSKKITQTAIKPVDSFCHPVQKAVGVTPLITKIV